MADDNFLEDLDLPPDGDVPSDTVDSADDDGTDSVSMDMGDLFTENGDLNLDALAPQDSSSPSKVELDLDDAPFLNDFGEEEEEEKPAEQTDEEAPVAMETAAEPEPQTGLKKLLKNKKFLIGGGSGLAALLALLLFLILSGGDEPQPPLPPHANEAPEVKLPPIEAKPGEVLIRWEPFWIEYIDEASGEVRFLVCELSAPTTDLVLKSEADANLLAIRDAIYYYLAHKALTFLSNQQNAETMKGDLVDIINGYLTYGQLSQVYIENYLIK